METRLYSEKQKQHIILLTEDISPLFFKKGLNATLRQIVLCVANQTIQRFIPGKELWYTLSRSRDARHRRSGYLGEREKSLTQGLADCSLFAVLCI